MKKAHAWLLACLILMALPLMAFAIPKRGKVKLRSGQEIEGVIEEFDDRVEVQVKYGTITSTVTYRRRDVDYIIYSDAGPVLPKPDETEESGLGPDEPAAVEQKYFVDLLGRFSIEAPNAWKIVETTHPALRAAMRHEDEDKACFMNISVYPLDGEFPNADQKRVDGLRSLQDRISQQAQAIFVSSGTTRNVKVVEFFATPVFEARYVLGQGANQRDVIELRFAQGGFEYALRVGSRSAFFKEVEPWLWEALESFSFLPPVETSRKHFHDSVNGFRVTSPEGRWSLSADVFNATRPVNIVHESGQASVEVWLLPGTRTPGEIIGGAIADFKSRPGGECTILKEDDKGRNGVQAMFRVIRGFAERATKAEEFYYLVSTRGDRILRIIGRGPASGDLSGQLRDELTAFFEAARLFDADTSKAQLAEANQATERFGEGLNRFRSRDYEGAITAFGEALALFPNFRQVYLERAKVNEQLKRWDDYRSDLERALDLEDDPELGVKVSLSFYEEGKEATAQKDYDKAVQLMTRAYRRDKKNELIENGLLQAYALYQTDRIRSKNYRDAIKTMRSGARVVKNPRMLDLLANAIVEEGKSFLQQRKPRNALSNAKDALRIVKGYAPAEALKNSAERAIEAEKK